MENILLLQNLIDDETLRILEDAFCEMTDMGAGISSPDGVALTTHSHTSEFCRCIKNSPVGLARCEKCDSDGTRMALEKKATISYQCHAGLIDFAAPITANQQLIGCFLGGQVLTSAPDEDRARAYAKEIGIDSDILAEALKKIPIITERQLEDSAELLHTLANILSDIGYQHYQILKSNDMLEQATQAKSDFLANMSHEIRTPMNAIIGMSEMALREKLPPAAKEYINQIKTSGQTLLTIINDILDFSKIESGTIDIHVSEYNPMALISGVINTICTRIGNKEIEFIIDTVPDLPETLCGDHVRLTQIIINLTNNAVKFTQHGRILLKAWYDRLSEEQILLHVSVQDTGSGIHTEDFDKLFGSFERINEAENHQIEGTGLGLAITKQLLDLMDGTISVESEYGRGSTFSFTVPQKIVRDIPCIRVKQPETAITAALVQNEYAAPQLELDLKRLGAAYIPVDSEDSLPSILQKDVRFLFIEHALFTDRVETFVREHPDITTILMVRYQTTLEYDIPNLMVMKKPLYTLNLAGILNHENMLDDLGGQDEKIFDFIAPEAEVLIVDDNAINLTVAEGLLEPLQMHIDTALNAKTAIDMISEKHYDLIFMDHMMPEVDGVEATHIIRRFHKDYQDTPIIALTANAMDGAREMFLEEGMNDFVAKPIELPVILSKLRHWLPKKKIQHVDAFSVTEPEESELYIDGLDTTSAIRLLGSESLYLDVLKDYYRVIRKKADLIQQYEKDEDWTNYTIEVHALKSASRQIGAMELGEFAARLERAGNEKNGDIIHAYTAPLLELYLKYDTVLAPYFETADTGEPKPPVTLEQLRQFFAALRVAFDNLDMDLMEKVIQDMEGFQYPKGETTLFRQLCDAVADLDTDASEEIIQKWEEMLP